MNKPVGGRGHKAAYQTTVIRIPNNLKPQIENVKELAAQDPTGQLTFETMKTRRTLEEIAKEDSINRAGIKILNKQLISNYVNKITDAENLNKLVVKLEQIRDNPEHYQDIERQNDNL